MVFTIKNKFGNSRSKNSALTKRAYEQEGQRYERRLAFPAYEEEGQQINGMNAV